MLMLDKLIKTLKENNFEKFYTMQDDALNVLKENDPSIDDTLGILIYKLSCVTIQMFNNQEILYKMRHMTSPEFIMQYGDKLDELHNILKRCCDLNYQRSLLTDAIDQKVIK